MLLGTTYRINLFEFQVYNDIALSYAGLAKLGGRPGQSAHFAATVKLQVCQENMTSTGTITKKTWILWQK